MAVDFQGLVAAAPVVIAVLDRERRYVFVNDAVAQIGLVASRLIGTRNDELIPADAVAQWRDSIADVLATRAPKELECTFDTPRGKRQYAALISALDADHVCVISRDVTDVRSGLLLDSAVRAMAMGFVIVEAPSRQVLFQNAETERVLGTVPTEEGPIARALAGEVITGEHVAVQRPDGRRTIRVNASPVRDASGTLIAAVATYFDITDSERAAESARFLAAAGTVLERFEPGTSLQAIASLAVPALADWCFVHLTTPAGVVTAAMAHADPVTLAEARARSAGPHPLSSRTAVSRVLDGGPPELVQVDEGVLAQAALDDEQLAQFRATGFRSAVVAPLVGRTGVHGAVTFAMARSGRRYDDTDLRTLAELSRRTAIALENAQLLAAEQAARRAAEQARDRTRRLHALTDALSTPIERDEVIAIFIDAARSAIGADASLAWLLRDEHTLELAGAVNPPSSPLVSQHRCIAMDAGLPVCEATRTGEPLMFESVAAMQRAFPRTPELTTSPYKAWAVVPLVVGGAAIGAVSFSLREERAFSSDDRELLVALSGQASLALERCRLIHSERRARADAEAARQRERQLHVLAAKLSSALTQEQILAIARSEANAAFIADSTTSLGADPATTSTIHVTGRTIAVPFSFEAKLLGTMTLVLRDERELTVDERELLQAMGQLTAQALERARLGEAHQQSEEQLRTALVAAGAATWSVDLATMKSRRDPSYQALVGSLRSDVDANFMSVHPEDRDIARAAFAHALQTGATYEPIVRIERDDGTYFWIQAHGRLTYDTSGNPVAMSGVIVDIDAAKRASERAEVDRRINETMHRLASSFASELEHDRLVRLIIDEVAKAVGAQSAAFIPGAETPDAPSTASYLEVPIVSRSGETFGHLVFRHLQPGWFSDEHQRLVASVASQAAVAMENARLYRDVREHKEQLEQAIERAIAADRRKDEFLAMLGHELRNPLAPILTALDLIDLKGVDAIRKEREIIRRQVTHLSHLIDDLLDVSRITRGKIQLEKKATELAAVLAKAVEMAQPLLEKRRQKLDLQLPPDGALVDADTTRLAQVFQNLLTNAAKYSDPESRIEVRCSMTDTDIAVAIRDEGIGIGADLLPRLFDMFVQGERTLDRSQGGLGIGLTVARSLVELHGGTIEAASEGIGKGTTFTVRLPRSARMRVATEAMRPLQVSDRPRTPGARVLVVDDNIDAAVMLREMLSALGHQLEIAHDGPTALELAARFKPEFAVLDIGLPVMNGYELATKLREQLGPDTLRLIAVTGYGQDTDRARSREVGFDHHLIKPIALDALLALLTK